MKHEHVLVRGGVGGVGWGIWKMVHTFGKILATRPLTSGKTLTRSALKADRTTAIRIEGPLIASLKPTSLSSYLAKSQNFYSKKVTPPLPQQRQDRPFKKENILLGNRPKISQ